ncbi:mandelate racemase/muconate lactonizing enzyme family protein [Rhizobium laguerreae]|uniref:mandelate racemase/muconate lactonizing enzyme family protein n=1 Tax=Rhizobium laguerreae TaxID=1076926 RepID=UPI001C916229|nr:mandelate racemase/muconate lactonizing enzyme family protein [Rhizobium laguerreae]MBY3342196.1 mandelate racemase/muconate lactonizing enzyme family protein [Rhizobium laguerreae]MBY3349231.1 mandelate racemase/muconate lactonizing enzyme family protein [Rhizobium laguerreae]MBY3370334.1 mandelate racemase/muconate lactonizing enzyme family protein [Rhizobium laguerreae]MBY3425574.1 mandelate racemase/muconate lactonizing enzyme family protein [Rhizobium laguerreae]MBY3434969.1 mandelate 
MDSVQRSTGQAILISDVVAHPLSQMLPKPTVTSWGTYHEVSMVLVEVRTDAGIVGVGEVLARFSPKAYAELIETSLKPRLIGQDARNIGALWQSMRRSLSGRAGGMLIEAIAGVDIALWDIMGKAAGMPIAKLLGGIGRETIEVYAAAVNWVDDAEADRELERYIGERFPRIKVKMANPVREACRRIERLRKRAGDDIELCVDANWAYDLDQAIEVGRALSTNGYFWFEEPLAPENEQGYEELRKRCGVPLAAGESNFTADQAQRLVANRTLSILQPDVARAGGISETRRMADYAALHDVGYAPHIGMSGIICETASTHLAAALPNFRVMECECDLSPFKRDLADLAPGCLRQKNGRLDVPTRPGLGIEIDWDAVKRLRVQ